MDNGTKPLELSGFFHANTSYELDEESKARMRDEIDAATIEGRSFVDVRITLSSDWPHHTDIARHGELVAAHRVVLSDEYISPRDE